MVDRLKEEYDTVVANALFDWEWWYNLWKIYCILQLQKLE
jgi:hypothetical protein